MKEKKSTDISLNLFTDNRFRSNHKKMGKNMWDGLILDSEEEYLFLCWCKEATELGYLQLISWQPQYCLSEKRTRGVLGKKGRVKNMHLMAKHNYTGDVILKLLKDPEDANGFSMLNRLIGSHSATKGALITSPSDCVAVIDVKGGFGAQGSDAKFSVNQKWVYSKYGVYVNKVKIMTDGFFTKYWRPDEAKYTAKGNLWAKYKGCRDKHAAKKIIESK